MSKATMRGPDMSRPKPRLYLVAPKALVLIGALCATTCIGVAADSSTDRNPIADADHVWEFSDVNDRDGKLAFEAVGKCRLGVPGAADGDLCGEFSGGHLAMVDDPPPTIALDGNFSLALRVYLDPGYFDLDNDMNATVFEWLGKDKSGKRHLVSMEVLTLGYLRNDRFLLFMLDQFPYSVSLKRLRPNRWHNVIIRVENRESTLFVDGSVHVPKQHRRLYPSNSTMAVSPADVIDDDYFIVGNDRDGELPFQGRISRVAIWDRSLSDAEVARLSGVDALTTDLPLPADWGKRWAGLYDENATPEEAYPRLHQDFEASFRRALKEDKHFPRFHLTMPGMMTEPSTSTYRRSKGYHIFPHDCSHWAGHFYYRANHMWQHFYSEDLVSWRMMPVPGWEHANNGNIIETGQGAICYPVFHGKKGWTYERWISRDELLENWEYDKDIELPKPPGGLFPMNHFLFEHGGRQYLLGAYASNALRDPDVGKRLELYRSRNNTWDDWEYVGVFYEGEFPGTHHPRLFEVDGKMVGDSDKPIDKGAWFLLGRFENEQFIREAGGDFHFDEQGWSWGQAITEEDGRVVRWTLIRSVTSEKNLLQDVARRGWQNVYSVPRIMGVRYSELTQEPAPELAALRKQAQFSARNKTIPEGAKFFPELSGSRAAVEIRCSFRANTGNAGIELQSADDGLIRFFYDGSSSKLICDTSQSKSGGASPQTALHDVAETAVTVEAGETIELILYFDHSVIEAFAGGKCTAARWFPDSPEDIRIGFYAENEEITFEKADIWEMGTIWREYAHE